jgi:hypothetical protein
MERQGFRIGDKTGSEVVVVTEDGKEHPMKHVLWRKKVRSEGLEVVLCERFNGAAELSHDEGVCLINELISHSGDEDKVAPLRDRGFIVESE